MERRVSQDVDHASYRNHQRQIWTQILLPLMLALVVFLGAVAAACVIAFDGQGDVGRWAAISTIWLILPGLLLELIGIAALVAVIYLVAKLRGAIPPYSRLAQRAFSRVESTARRGSEMVRSPKLAVQGFGNFVRGRFERRAWMRKT